MDWGFRECQAGPSGCHLFGEKCGGVGPGGLVLSPAGSATHSSLIEVGSGLAGLRATMPGTAIRGSGTLMMGSDGFARSCDGVIVSRSYDDHDRNNIIESTRRISM